MAMRALAPRADPGQSRQGVYNLRMAEDRAVGELRIVSGGQTGVDRAALDAALALGLPCGGWCPRGRWAEDGPIDPRYPLTETPLADPARRTQWNVRDSEGTLVLLRGTADGGTALTIQCAERSGKPCLVVHLDQPENVAALREWLAAYHIRVLNVAGPAGRVRAPASRQSAFKS